VLWIDIDLLMPIHPDWDPSFHFDAKPDPDPGWRKNNADPHVDATPKFYRWVSPFELSHFFAKLEGTDSDLDKTLHICLDSQETAKNKI
jgi:hypothetical protein